MKPASLTWTPFRDDDLCGVHVWEASETEKWIYSITLKCTSDGQVSFVASRMSTNDGLAHEDIGDLKEECATLQDAMAVVENWHAEQYADNDAEFDSWGGNTAAREEFEANQWSGQFKCRSCGQPITDGYRIQGILHHGCELKCEDCAQTD